VFGAAAKVFASYSGAFQKMKRIIKGSSRMLGHELRLRNGKFVFLFHHDLVPLFLFPIAHSITATHTPLLNYLHCGIIAEPMVAESLYLISSCAFWSLPNPRVGHLGCTVLCTFRQHDRSHPRWCEGAWTSSISRTGSRYSSTRSWLRFARFSIAACIR
jgi:hypothetical protein